MAMQILLFSSFRFSKLAEELIPYRNFVVELSKNVKILLEYMFETTETIYGQFFQFLPGQTNILPVMLLSCIL
jgi:hypothetical protein